jgi:P22_AR N-terminal domain/ORF6C domain
MSEQQSEGLDELPQRRPRVEMITFDGDALVAVVLHGEGVAVPVRTICLALGLDVQSQSDRLRNHDVLARGLRIVKVPVDSQLRSVVAILHDYIPFWLGTITPSLVRDEIREKLVHYQLELKDLLNAVYGSDAALAASGESAASIQGMQRQVRAALHELRLLRAQLLETQQTLADHLATQDLRITNIEGVLDARLGELARQIDVQQEQLVEQEALIAEHTPITPAQTATIKRMVQSIAKRYQKKHDVDVFARIYGEFSFAMRIPSYDKLPARQYDAALAWLRAKADDMGVPDAVPGVQEKLL